MNALLSKLEPHETCVLSESSDEELTTPIIERTENFSSTTVLCYLCGKKYTAHNRWHHVRTQHHKTVEIIVKKLKAHNIDTSIVLFTEPVE